MRIDDLYISDSVIEKLAAKHNVQPSEVEEVLFNEEEPPYVRFVEKGHTPGEDLYNAFGRTEAGRYLSVYFLYKPIRLALVVSAYDMTETERRQYERR